MEIIDFALPFVIKPEAQQLVDLDVAVEVLLLDHRVVVS